MAVVGGELDGWGWGDGYRERESLTRIEAQLFGDATGGDGVVLVVRIGWTEMYSGRNNGTGTRAFEWATCDHARTADRAALS